MAGLLCVLACVPAPGRAQDLEGWIQRLGEAAAERPPAVAPVAAPPGGATVQGCATESSPGDLVLRGGGSCAARQMAEAVLSATRAMNARTEARADGRAEARDCRGVDACRHRAREERLRQVASMNHEEAQMARSHSRGAPSNVALPPPRSSTLPNWTWRPYR